MRKKYKELKDYEDICYCNEPDLNNFIICSGYKDDDYVTIKIKDKNKLNLYNSIDLDRIKREIEFSKKFKSENIIKLKNVYDNQDYIMLVYEEHQSNLNYVLLNDSLRGNDLKKFIIDIGKALKEIYSENVIHRNINPENIYYTKNDKVNKGDILFKLGNFEYATYIKDNKSEPVGNMAYTAPEIIKNKEYDEKCDLWSLGVILYELYFDKTPFGLEKNVIREMKSIFEQKNIRLKRTNIPSLDILLHRLLVIDPKERITYNEFFDLIFNEDFMKKDKDIIYINNNEKYKKLYDDILAEPFIEYPCESKVEVERKIYLDNFEYERLIDDIYNFSFPDIANLENKYNSEEKYNNIIYYDENINNLKSIIHDTYYIEKFTNGAFILSTSIKSLELIKDEILTKNEKLNTIFYFNIITTGSSFEKIINFIQNNKNFEKCVKNMCIYCFEPKKYLKFKKAYKIINDVHNKLSDVINYIKDFSSNEIRPFPLNKIITFENYLYKYKYIHFIISMFYGDLTEEKFKKILKEMKLKNVNDEMELFLRCGYNLKKIFPCSDDFRLNSPAVNLDEYHYEKTIKNKIYLFYCISRKTYFLNYFASTYNKYYCEKEKLLYIGEKISYFSLSQYEKEKGKIIIFSNFMPAFEDKILAINFSGRNNSIEVYNKTQKFSVFYVINCINREKGNCLPFCIKAEKEREKNDKIEEVIFQPFSFFYLKEIIIDYENYTANIFLEALDRNEILEEKIRDGGEIEYNEKEKIMQIKK